MHSAFEFGRMSFFEPCAVLLGPKRAHDSGLAEISRFRVQE